MIRRLLLTSTLALAALLPVASAAAHEEPPTTATTSTEATPSSGPATSSTERLPGTSLEADQRDDGGTSAAPWVIGSGAAALAVVGVGGWVLKRRAG